MTKEWVLKTAAHKDRSLRTELRRYHPAPLPRPLHRIDQSGRCRVCRMPSWLADDTGPVHECCAYWGPALPEGRGCPACAEAARAPRERVVVAEEPDFLADDWDSARGHVHPIR